MASLGNKNHTETLVAIKQNHMTGIVDSATDIEITLQILWKLLLPDSEDILSDHRSLKA